MRRSRRSATVLTIGAVVFFLSGCGRSWHNTLVSVNAAGTDTGNGASGRIDNPIHQSDYVFSPDGTKLAFLSRATDIDPLDTDFSTDIFIRDLAAGRTSLVTVSASGTSGGDNDSYDPVFSPDGTKIAFTSTASNLHPDDTNLRADIYVRDLVTGTTELVSRSAAGSGAANSLSHDPVFNRDGTKIGFLTMATDLGFADVDNCPVFPDPRPRPCDDAVVRDLATGSVTLLTATAAGTSMNGPAQRPPAFSPTGDLVIYENSEAQLPADTNGVTDLYVRDLGTGAVTLLSDVGGGPANGSSIMPVFSPDGAAVAYTSTATNLGPVDTDAAYDIFLEDLGSGTVELVTPNSAGTDSADGASLRPMFGPDGQRIAFMSDSGNLVPGLPPPSGCSYDYEGLYVRDVAADTTTHVLSNGTEENGTSCRGRLNPAFSRHSALLAFDTNRPLSSADANTRNDVYVYDLASGAFSLVSVTGSGAAAAGYSSSAVFSPTEDEVAFYSFAADIAPVDTNETIDLFVSAT